MGWVIAVILALFLIGARSELKALRERKSSLSAAPMGGDSLAQARQDLIILRLELNRRRAAGEIDTELYRHLTEQIDAQWAAGFEAAWVTGDLWRQCCEAAWRQLAVQGRVPFGSPPWQRATPPPALNLTPPVKPAPSEKIPPTVPPVPSKSAVQPALTGKSVAPEPIPQPTPPAVPAGEAVIPETPAVGQRPPAVSLPPVVTPAEQAVPPVTRAEPAAEPGYAWQPQEPGVLEKALRAVSGWPRAMLPFLVQNIGWFIGGFCFLAGSIFLVSYTSGFLKGLLVFATLFAYTGFLLWAGYQLRLKRPELKAGSSVLLAIGMLLVPLNLSAVARLLVYSEASGWLLGVSVLIALLALALFLLATRLVAGITDRALQGEQPRLYLALAAMQLAVPLIAQWPAWPLLALLHCLLLGLLGYGLWRYAQDWMYSIFVERRRMAYFAGGTLLYAALISFVHLTWGAVSLAVPAGYYAPYLMTVCGLLFYLDAHFKEWAHQYTFLSRFSFLVYGLSVLAVVLAWDAPLARRITLTLAAVIYGMVAWQYLTLIPLCLLLASLGGLYSQLVLNHFPADQQFLWSLPGLAGILILNRWAQRLAARRPGACPLALLLYRLLLLLGLGLAGWSLYHARPGPLAMTTALVVAAGLWWLLQAAPGPLLGRLDEREPGLPTPRLPQDLRNGPWLYSVVLAVTAAVAFAPAWSGLSGELRFALGLLLLSWLWTWLAVSGQQAGGPWRTRVEVFANSALLSMLAGVGLALGFSVGSVGRDGVMIMALGAAALTSLWLSLGLYVRWLVYGFLVLAGAATVLSKLAFFPGPATGTVPLVAGLGVWGLLLWLDRQSDEAAALRRARIRRPLTLLWLLPLAGVTDAGASSGWNGGGQEDREPFGTQQGNGDHEEKAHG
jgi:hypothetical protein